MSSGLGYLIALVISVLVTAYLLAAMLFPERF
jgi:K+-transporting ATPase KdpF subunit